MRIESSALALKSSNAAYSRYEKTEQLQVGQIQSDAKGNRTIANRLNVTQTVVEEHAYLSTYAEFVQQNITSPVKRLADQMANAREQAIASSEVRAPDSKAANKDVDQLFKLSASDKLKLLLLMKLFNNIKKDPELMKALGLDKLEDLDVNSLGGAGVQGAVAQNQPTPPPPPAVNPANSLAIDYSVHESLYQAEVAQFSVAGQVKTADGQTININVDLQMSREVLQTKDFSMRLGAVTKDPLIVNFDGGAAELSSDRFSFDLTADGKKDLIPKLLSNSGFLALDRNQDGHINDGTELFGARTGDGFAELAQYDDDKNGWIDENDAVFKDLLLWRGAGTNSEKLVDLKSAGVGAIYTGKAATPFHLQNQNAPDETLGVIQSTGVFLKEEGGVGTIQHVDLAV